MYYKVLFPLTCILCNVILILWHLMGIPSRC